MYSNPSSLEDSSFNFGSSSNSANDGHPNLNSPPQKGAFKIGNLFNFGWWSKQSTSYTPILKGTLPTVNTVLALLFLSLAIAGAGTLWAGTIKTIGAFVPIYAKTIASITGLALLNFWFQRDFLTSSMGVREIVGTEYECKAKLEQLVEKVRRDLNVHFKKTYGENHKDLPECIRLGTFASSEKKIVMVLGRDVEHAALFFSSEILRSASTNWDEDQLGAIIAHRMAQIYFRQGASSTIVSIVTDFFRTIDAFEGSNNWVLRGLGWIGLRLGSIALLFQRSIERSYSYRAAEVLNKIGRGYDFYQAIDIANCDSTRKSLTPAQLSYLKERTKRKPYDGWFASWGLRRAFDWMDDLEWIRKNTSGYRIIDFFDGLVREGGFFYFELLSLFPRATRLKDYLRVLLGIGRLSEELPKEDNLITVEDWIESLVEKKLIFFEPREAIFEKIENKIKRLKTIEFQNVSNWRKESLLRLPEDVQYVVVMVVFGKEFSMVEKVQQDIKQRLQDLHQEQGVRMHGVGPLCRPKSFINQYDWSRDGKKEAKDESSFSDNAGLSCTSFRT